MYGNWCSDYVLVNLLKIPDRCPSTCRKSLTLFRGDQVYIILIMGKWIVFILPEQKKRAVCKLHGQFANSPGSLQTDRLLVSLQNARAVCKLPGILKNDRVFILPVTSWLLHPWIRLRNLSMYRYCNTVCNTEIWVWSYVRKVNYFSRVSFWWPMRRGR